ncbi:MAG: putative nicotinate-nucleotide adenylyltransferase [Wendovervirus sonii]|uniref:Nicotinate-nucleotide adenylyltransferase n=1 Tax=phage Lak_Megaphage_Sonny TaxID=3109229 RepID=A0ABZ0Z2L4_9CAUD|nr:MAG: putative nicotinate-nucleotide adenylyltransferase [phage Lak_Megaphage_Sonny]
MKIGIFPGTFDPIHIGHESIIAEAVNSNIVDKIIIIPAFRNPWKETPTVPFIDRFNMCHIAAENINNLIGHKKVFASAIENTMHDLQNNGPIYTANILKYLKYICANDTLCLLCGTDVKENIINWHDGQWIIDNCEIINVDRLGMTSVSIEKGIKISSTAIREMLKNNEMPYPYISKDVYDYIKKNHLY